MTTDTSNTTLYDVIRILNYGQKNKIERQAAPTDIQVKRMSSVSCPIELRFIKHAPTTPQEDEIIRITPHMVDGKPGFMWRYLYESKQTANVCILKDEFFLFEKLRTLKELIAWDADPYASVQILLPTTPSVLLRASDFSEAFDNVCDSIRSAIRHWPVMMNVNDAKKMAATGQQSLQDSSGSYTRSGCSYSTPKKVTNVSDDASTGPPPLVRMRRSSCSAAAGLTGAPGANLNTSYYSYFGKSHPTREDSPWEV